MHGQRLCCPKCDRLLFKHEIKTGVVETYCTHCHKIVRIDCLDGVCAVWLPKPEAPKLVTPN